MTLATRKLISITESLQKDVNLNINLEEFKREVKSLFWKINRVNKFTSNEDFKKVVFNILSARVNYDNCINMLKSYLELEENTYIQMVNNEFKSYDGFMIYLGISNARLDVLYNQLNEMRFQIFSAQFYSLFESFRSTLKHYAYSFLYLTINNAYSKFLTQEKLTILEEDGMEKDVIFVKNRNWFFYKLFLEMFRVAETEGAIARQAILASKIPGLKNVETADDTVKRPPTNPSNAEYSEISSREQIINSLNIDNVPEEDLYV